MQSLNAADRKQDQGSTGGGVLRAVASRFLDVPVVRAAARKLARVRMPRHAGTKGVVALFVATAVYGVVIGGHTDTVLSAVSSWSGLGIREIEITGQSEASEAEILRALEVGPFPSLLTLDVDSARARIEALPWVEVATLTKLFPGTLKVEVGERQPFALWQQDGIVYLIDEDGEVIDEAPPGRFTGLPFVVGAGAEARVDDLLALLEVAPSVHDDLRAAVWVSGQRWTLVLENGIELMLPVEAPEAALAEIARLDREKQLLSREIASVDYRFEDKVLVRLTDEGIKAREKLLKEREREARRRRSGA